MTSSALCKSSFKMGYLDLVSVRICTSTPSQPVSCAHVGSKLIPLHIPQQLPCDALLAGGAAHCCDGELHAIRELPWPVRDPMVATAAAHATAHPPCSSRIMCQLLIPFLQ